MTDVKLLNTARIALIDDQDSDLVRDFEWVEAIGESSDERFIMKANSNEYLSAIILERMGKTPRKRTGGNLTRWRLAQRP
jgi:hypothetical protein